MDGKRLPLTLCDTMGLEEGLNAGLDIDDFTSILKGHIQDKYQVGHLRTEGWYQDLHILK